MNQTLALLFQSEYIKQLSTIITQHEYTNYPFENHTFVTYDAKPNLRDRVEPNSDHFTRVSDDFQALSVAYSPCDHPSDDRISYGRRLLRA